MATNADYESLLRSLASLPQQFGPKYRYLSTPPNPLMNHARPSSRVTKPLSATSSPISKASQQRRRALTARAASTHSTPHKSQALVNRPSQATWSQTSFADPNNVYPWGWHANAHLASMWNSFPTPSSDSYWHPTVTTRNFADQSQWSQPDDFWPNSYQQPVYQPQQMPQMPWSTQAGYGYNQSIPSISLDQQHVNDSAPQNDAFEQDAESEEDSEDDDADGDLVGLGLYDREQRPSSQRTLLLGASLEEHEPVKADEEVPSMLEEGWAPPADQVPDAEADDGPDTPTINHQTWIPGYADGTAFPQPEAQMSYQNDASFGASDDFGLPVVYDWQGNIVDAEALATQQQAMASGWYGSDWQAPGAAATFTDSPYS